MHGMLPCLHVCVSCHGVPPAVLFLSLFFWKVTVVVLAGIRGNSAVLLTVHIVRNVASSDAKGYLSRRLGLKETGVRGRWGRERTHIACISKLRTYSTTTMQ